PLRRPLVRRRAAAAVALFAAVAPGAVRAQSDRAAPSLGVWAADGRMRRVPLVSAAGARGPAWFVRADELAAALGSGVSTAGPRRAGGAHRAAPRRGRRRRARRP